MNVFWITILSSIFLTDSERLQCGIRKLEPVNYLYGSHQAPKYFWPWVASIQTLDNPGLNLCGGVLIGPWMVMTAAHCMIHRSNGRRLKPDEILVVVGSYDLRKRDRSQQDKRVHFIHYPNRWQNASYSGNDEDVALLELTRRVELIEEKVWPACIPEWGEAAPGPDTSCVVYGYGMTEGNLYPEVLMHVVIPLLSRDRCKRTWKDLGDWSFCGGKSSRYRGRAIGPCQGDSGGPVLCLNRGGSYTVYGIVSYGSILCLRKPSVFTDISRMDTWVRRVFKSRGMDIPEPPKKKSISKIFRSPVPFNNRARCGPRNYMKTKGLFIQQRPIMKLNYRGLTPRHCQAKCCDLAACKSFVFVRRRKKFCDLLSVNNCTAPEYRIHQYESRTIILYEKDRYKCIRRRFF